MIRTPLTPVLPFEYGFMVARGIRELGRYRPEILEDAENTFSAAIREFVADPGKEVTCTPLLAHKTKASE